MHSNIKFPEEYGYNFRITLVKFLVALSKNMKANYWQNRLHIHNNIRTVEFDLAKLT